MRNAAESKRRWGWLLLLPVLVWLHGEAQTLPIDRHNVAMRAKASPEADAAKQLRAVFGDQDPVVLAFHRIDGQPLADAQARKLDDHVAALEGERGVVGTGRREQPRPDVAVYPIHVSDACDTASLTQAARDSLPEGIRCASGGLPVLEQAIALAIASDRDRVVPILAVSLLCVLAALFRSIGQAVCGFAPAITTILALGAMRARSGAQLNPITVLLDPVLLTVGVAAAVHAIASFRRLRAEGLTPHQAAATTRVELTRPATLATLTTMLGFASLAFHPIPAVADFGRWASFSVGLVHAFVLLALPRMLADLAPAPARGPSVAAGSGFVARLQRRRRPILIASAATAILAVVALTRATVDNDPMSVLPATHPERIQSSELARIVGGNDRFCLLFEQAAKLGPERLKLFCADAGSTWPAAGLAGRPLLGDDHSAMVPLLLLPSGSNDRCKLFQAIADKAAALGMKGVRPAGTSVQIARDSQRLVHGQLLGIAATCVLLAITLALALRSARAGILGMIPNVLPCLWLYGGITMLDHPLTVANAMIGSVMLGLVVDNTIHVMHRFQQQEGRVQERVASALAHTMAPMLVSSAVLAVGLGAGVAGEMQSTKDFAVLAATTIGLALVGDAVVLPALLLRQRNEEALA
jgi:uncharacterized protein